MRAIFFSSAAFVASANYFRTRPLKECISAIRLHFIMLSISFIAILILADVCVAILIPFLSFAIRLTLFVYLCY